MRPAYHRPRKNAKKTRHSPLAIRLIARHEARFLRGAAVMTNEVLGLRADMESPRRRAGPDCRFEAESAFPIHISRFPERLEHQTRRLPSRERHGSQSVAGWSVRQRTTRVFRETAVDRRRLYRRSPNLRPRASVGKPEAKWPTLRLPTRKSATQQTWKSTWKSAIRRAPPSWPVARTAGFQTGFQTCCVLLRQGYGATSRRFPNRQDVRLPRVLAPQARRPATQQTWKSNVTRIWQSVF
jgi:hypothetical protein